MKPGLSVRELRPCLLLSSLFPDRLTTHRFFYYDRNLIIPFFYSLGKLESNVQLYIHMYYNYVEYLDSHVLSMVCM